MNFNRVLNRIETNGLLRVEIKSYREYKIYFIL